MDRLPTLTLALALLSFAACKGSSERSSSAKGGNRDRVQSVASTQSKADIANDFCDATPNTSFTPPALADAKSFAKTNKPHWVNLWATWCEPCIEEMPRLVAWQEKWQTEGFDVQLSFLSADDDAPAVDAFRSQHPKAPETLRVADVQDAKSWLASLGIDEMTLPVHVLIDAEGTVLCVRTSSVEDHDERSVRALLQ